jgi:hypothetical protein
MMVPQSRRRQAWAVNAAHVVGERLRNHEILGYIKGKEFPDY